MNSAAIKSFTDRPQSFQTTDHYDHWLISLLFLVFWGLSGLLPQLLLQCLKLLSPLLLSVWVYIFMPLVRFVSCPGDLIFLQFLICFWFWDYARVPPPPSPPIPDHVTQLPSTRERQDSVSLDHPLVSLAVG